MVTYGGTTSRPAQRMRLILQLADGASYSEIQESLGVAATTIARWKKRYEEEGLTGLATASWTASAVVHSGVARQDPGSGQGVSAGWLHALELAQGGQGTQSRQRP